jgi:hypothetical protein
MHKRTLNVATEQGYANVYTMARRTIKQIKYTYAPDNEIINGVALSISAASFTLRFSCYSVSMLQVNF